MRVLIIGGGGREHALAWKLAQSSSISGIFASPGNPGIAQIGVCLPVPTDVSGYVHLARAYKIDLTVVGPEAPLVAGVVDQFGYHGLRIIGPTQAAAKLEGSKIFAKQFFERAGIPTARSVQVTTYDEALTQLRRFPFPVVIKADGLAAGKGVIIAQDAQEATQAIQQLGPTLVLEEFLEGEEVSFMGLCGPVKQSNNSGIRDSEQLFLAFAPTQDHKRLFDADQGPNTGGMGAYSDNRILTQRESDQIMDEIMFPALSQMRAEGHPFTGFLYAGLMMTENGPKVLEFNVRLGDPETQALMYSCQGDLWEVVNAMTSDTGVLPPLAWELPSVCVVLAAAGYPNQPQTGQVINGIETAENTGTTVFQAGTALEDKSLVTYGGRVLGITASGATLPTAIQGAYTAVNKISFAGMQYRRDIGKKGLIRW